MFKVTIKTKTTPVAPCSIVSNVNLEHVVAGCVFSSSKLRILRN